MFSWLKSTPLPSVEEDKDDRLSDLVLPIDDKSSILITGDSEVFLVKDGDQKMPYAELGTSLPFPYKWFQNDYPKVAKSFLVLARGLTNRELILSTIKALKYNIRSDVSIEPDRKEYLTFYETSVRLLTDGNDGVFVSSESELFKVEEPDLLDRKNISSYLKKFYDSSKHRRIKYVPMIKGFGSNWKMSKTMEGEREILRLEAPDGYVYETYLDLFKTNQGLLECVINDFLSKTKGYWSVNVDPGVNICTEKDMDILDAYSNNPWQVNSDLLDLDVTKQRPPKQNLDYFDDLEPIESSKQGKLF